MEMDHEAATCAAEGPIRPPPPGVMRVAVALSLLFGLLFAEAYYQRHRYRKREFVAPLETMRASLSDYEFGDVAYRKAHQRFATAARRVLEEAQRRVSP